MTEGIWVRAKLLSRHTSFSHRKTKVPVYVAALICLRGRSKNIFLSVEACEIVKQPGSGDYKYFMANALRANATRFVVGEGASE